MPAKAGSEVSSHRPDHRPTRSLAVGAALGAAPASAHDGEDHIDVVTRGKLPTGVHQALGQARSTLSVCRDPAAAVAAGYIPTDTCIASAAGGMGYHYVNIENVMAGIDINRPPVLVYVPTPNGGRTVGAAEWGAIDGDQDLATDDDRPNLLGVPFNGPMLGHEDGEPIHYDLHAWLVVANPAGVLAPWNPKVTC